MPKRAIHHTFFAAISASLFAVCYFGCAASSGKGGPGGTGGGNDASISFDGGGEAGIHFDGSAGEGGLGTADPTTCEEAASGHTYLGCDFWPTVVDNVVDPIFDYAVVVGNTGTGDAVVTITGGALTSTSTTTIHAGQVSEIYLPWVTALKGAPGICGSDPLASSVLAKKGAYHLTSSVPVVVYQFSAVEYQAKGGPPGKDWSGYPSATCQLAGEGPYSYTNDASLLLPSTALTGNYRIAGVDAWTGLPDPSTGTTPPPVPPYFAVTGTQDGTTVTVQLSANGSVAGGGGIATVSGGGSLTFTLNAGDVAEVIGAGNANTDFSGSLLKASAPVQVLSGHSCRYMPAGRQACDHVEETVMPVETLGKHYFVTPPDHPGGAGTTSHDVRLYGNFDGTNLTYPGSRPSGAPSTLSAGQVADLGVVTSPFEIVGDHEFMVGSFMIGGGDPATDPNPTQSGDPSMSMMTTVEQYRTSYVFIAPTDYDENYVDIVQPSGATVTLDGKTVGGTPVAISSGYALARVPLTHIGTGAHTLTATQPVGIQVLGYGSYTSYQFPGGLNLGVIAPVPIH
ncbi:MAG: IgGFc-binding protein [Polyangiales bacterium]